MGSGFGCVGEGEKQKNTPPLPTHNPQPILTLIIAVFAAGILLRVAFLANIDYSGSVPDEKYYLSYSVYMAESPQPSFRTLVDGFIGNPANYIFPNPIRAGYILIASLWMRLVGFCDYKALSYLSALFSILSLFVGYIFTRRLFDKRIALLSLVLFASSPINLAFSMRALQESMVYFFFILTLYLFYRALKKEDILSITVFSASFFALVMVKESSVLLLPFFLIYIFIEKRFFSRELKALPLAGALIITLSAVFAAYLWITGGIINLAKMVTIILFSPLDNPWARAHLTGPVTRYLFDFFLLSPATLIAALGFFAYYITGREVRTEPATYLAAFFVVFYLAYSLYIKNVRYVIALDFPIRVFAVLAISEILRRIKVKRAFAAAAAIVLLIACSDLFIFYRMYVANPVFYDPITGNLLESWGKFVLR